MSLCTSFSNKLNQAKHVSVLACFFSVVLLFFTACSFDNDTGVYIATSNDQLPSARVIKIKDGDSLILRYANGVEKESRLFGIDAPEYNQPYGREAKQILEKLVLKKSVRVIVNDTDRYQRDVVSLVRSSDNRNINLELINLGAAWVYARYQDDQSWQDAQKKARLQQSGLWALPRPIAPWEWRNRAKPK